MKVFIGFSQKNVTVLNIRNTEFDIKMNLSGDQACYIALAGLDFCIG